LSDSYISENDALALLESKRAAHRTHAADVSQTDLTSTVRESATADATGAGPGSDNGDGFPEIGETYEILNSPPSRYLCTIPTIAKAPELNQTATELAKAEEARELNRASAKGWELVNGLEGKCLYYLSGWWSYTFCYGKDIVQFHAQPNTAGGKPVKDPASHEYVLGRAQSLTKSHGAQRNQNEVGQNQGATAPDSKAVAPPNTELQVKGDQRYLVQRLDGGTVCDLTGRPRTIEIQYHCSPGASVDHIGWIKEVTTCTYLMVVYTPRLCADVAFLPPKETRAHAISCRAIVGSDDELEAWKWRRTLEAKQAMGVTGAQKTNVGSDASKQHPAAGMTIGGVVVGGRRVLGSGGDGQEPVELKPPRGTVVTGRQAAAAAIEKLAGSAKKVGDGVGVVTADQLEELGFDQETLEALRKELQRLGGDDGWEIAVEVIPEAGESEGQKQVKREQAGSNGGKAAGTRDVKGSTSDEEEEGSEEIFYKDEL